MSLTISGIVDGSKGRVIKHSWYFAQIWPSAWISAEATSPGPLRSDSGPSPATKRDWYQCPPSQLWASCPCLPPGPHSVSFLPTSSPFPFQEQLCIIPTPLTSPFPNTPTCPFWFCASSWSVSSAKSNRCVWYWPARVTRLSVQAGPWPGLSLNWLKAGHPLSGALQYLSREVVKQHCLWPSVFPPPPRPPPPPPPHHPPPPPPEILFISLSLAPLSLLCCSSFLFCFNSYSLIKFMNLLRITLKKKAIYDLLKQVLNFGFFQIHKKHHNRLDISQKNNNWSPPP